MDKKTAAPFISRQTFILSDHMYEELKRVEKGEIVYEHLPLSMVMHVRKNNIVFVSEDLVRIENAVFYCIKELERGRYKNYGIRCGILSKTNSAFLEAFEKYVRIIANQRVITEPETTNDNGGWS